MGEKNTDKIRRKSRDNPVKVLLCVKDCLCVFVLRCFSAPNPFPSQAPFACLFVG